MKTKLVQNVSKFFFISVAMSVLSMLALTNQAQAQHVEDPFANDCVSTLPDACALYVKNFKEYPEHCYVIWEDPHGDPDRGTFSVTASSKAFVTYVRPGSSVFLGYLPIDGQEVNPGPEAVWFTVNGDRIPFKEFRIKPDVSTFTINLFGS